jgi:hypothetical protein
MRHAGLSPQQTFQHAFYDKKNQAPNFLINNEYHHADVISTMKNKAPHFFFE